MTGSSTLTALDPDDIEMTLTLAEWHLQRDTDATVVVVPHEQPLDLAA